MTTNTEHYWQIVVTVEGGATVTHTYSHESDARFQMAEWANEGFPLELVEVGA